MTKLFIWGTQIMNINRWGASLVLSHITLKYCARERERERERDSIVEDEQLFLLLGFYTVLGWILYWGSFAWFSPLWFLEENLCVLLCCCTCLSFNDPLLMVMMLNVFRYCITIKNITWNQRQPERILCATDTLLQIQLLNIRVPCLKTLEKN